MTDMSTMQKIYFICAWVVAGTALLALILEAVGWADWSGMITFGTVCEVLFLGITGCFTLLYLSGWFTHSLVLFILAWVVAGLAFLALIFGSVGYNVSVWGVRVFPVTLLIGYIFWNIAFGTFCTLLMLHLSGRFTKAE